MAFINNGSNATNITFDYDRYSFIQPVLSFWKGYQIFISIVGSLLNLWFLAAILSSPLMRSRLRNKIICNSFILHLLTSAILLPISSAIFYSNFYAQCVFYVILNHVNLIQDLVANWLLVMLIAVFIAQIEDFDPRARLSSRAVQFGTIALLVFPWGASLVIVPVIIHEYYKRFYSDSNFCIFATRDAQQVLRSIDTALPIILAVLLVTVAAFRKYRRFTMRNSPGTMQIELIGSGREIDNTLAYVTAVIVSTLCDLLQLFMTLKIYKFGRDEIKPYYYLWFSAMILTDSRAILAPLPWLLLPDVRQQIRTWRPWYRPAPGIDLTMTYTKEGQ